MIEGLTPDQIVIFKERQKESRKTEQHRRWAYNGNFGILCENEEQYEEIKDIYDQDRPEDNKSLVIKSLGQVRQEVRKAKRDLESKKEEKKEVKKAEKKVEKKEEKKEEK